MMDQDGLFTFPSPVRHGNHRKGRPNQNPSQPGVKARFIQSSYACDITFYSANACCASAAIRGDHKLGGAIHCFKTLSPAFV